MPTTLTLRDANQNFSRCVREVEKGQEFVITRNGKPVARLVPVEGAGRRVLTEAQQKAAAEMLKTPSWPAGRARRAARGGAAAGPAWLSGGAWIPTS
jgi:prevent-host-death family protein